MPEDKVKVTITKSPDFRLVYANGVFGGLSLQEGRITFYADRLIPKIAEDVPGGLRTGYVERELQVEVKMSPQQFLSISRWMQGHIKRLEKQGVLRIDKKKKVKEEKS